MFSSIIALLGLAVLPTSAQEPAAVRKFIVTPQAVPSPALRYQLLPPVRELTSGNAVQHYYRCMAHDAISYLRQKTFENHMFGWLNLPYEEASRKSQPASSPQERSVAQGRKKPAQGEDEESEPPGTREEMSILQQPSTLDEIDLAARRTHAQWDYLEQMKLKGMSLLLPELQGFRTLSNMVQLRARLALMDGQFDRSLYHQQTGMAMAQHLNETYLLIYTATGNAIARNMLKVTDEFIQHPQAPNLYWALSDLPQPLFDLRKAHAGDRMAIEFMLGDPKEMETRIFSSEEMQTLIKTRLQPLLRQSSQEGNVEFSFVVLKEYPRAKAWLLAQGRSAADVEKMTAAQAVILFARSRFQVLADDFAKQFHLPIAQRLEHTRAFHEKVKELRKQKDTSYFLGFYFYSYYPNVWATFSDTDREIALLRCVELLRDFAASHDRHLPESWDAVKNLPVPIDPVTGKRFSYQLQGDHAVITMDALADTQVFRTARKVEVYLK